MRNLLITVMIFLIFVSLELAADFTLKDPAPPFPETDQAPLTLILAGGTIYSGDARQGVAADVGILDDHIVMIGNLSAHSAELRLDVSGLAVTPGFIDIHSHAVRSKREESGIFLWPDAENYIRQGVTTVIGGPDGSSEYPVSILLADLEAAPAAVNFGTFVGHNTVRELAMGRENRAPTVQELKFMRDMVEIAMDEGAFGLSSGLKYIPGAYSSTGEVIALARVAGRHGGIYITHMREEGQGLIDSVAETIRIGEEGGLPAQITHHKAMGVKMWGRSNETLAMVNAANARGLDISIDQYPYSASSTGLRVLFPAWGMAGDEKERMARFQDPETRAAIVAGIVDNLKFDRGGNDPSRVAIAECSWDTSLNGRNLAEILAQRGMEVTIENAAELVLIMEESGGCSAVYHAMSEEDVIRIMQHPTAMFETDGDLVQPGVGFPHPRTYGSFPRILGRYVRELEALTLEEAVRKMTSAPADWLGQSDRGRLAVDMVADITVFDADRITDRAEFTDPHHYADGVVHVWVGGTAVLQAGEMTGALPGHFLERQRR